MIIYDVRGSVAYSNGGMPCICTHKLQLLQRWTKHVQTPARERFEIQTKKTISITTGLRLQSRNKKIVLHSNLVHIHYVSQDAYLVTNQWRPVGWYKSGVVAGSQ